MGVTLLGLLDLMGTITAARRHAVDVILRGVMRGCPTPPDRHVLLTDDLTNNRVGVRWHHNHQVYHLFTDRLAFEEDVKGNLIITPCPPRPAPQREPGVFHLVEASRLTYGWKLRHPNPSQKVKH